MKILYVEDDSKDFEFFSERLIGNGHKVQRAETNSQAKELLKKSVKRPKKDEDGKLDFSCLDNLVEYVILDLAIPFDSPDGDSEVKHGIELAIHIRSMYPGIPILVLTGQSSEPATEALEDDDAFAIFWDGERKTLFKIRKKRQFDEALRLVNEASSLLDSLDEFELDLEDRYCRENLSLIEQRIIKLFGVKAPDANVAKVKRLSGGLSGAKVLRVSLLNSMGYEIQSAVGKIDEFENATLETQNFEKYVTYLEVGSFPTSLGKFFAGCGNLCGVFFRLADSYGRTFFDVLKSSDEDAAQVLAELKQYESKWHRNYSEAVNLSVRDIRRTQISDRKFESVVSELIDFDISTFEDISVQVRKSVQHGDQHGGNVLVSESNDPVVIDYGDIGEYCCSLDPIVLLMSAYFHPDARGSFEQTSEIAANWFADNQQDLLSKVARPTSTKFLLDWASENSFSGREIVAVTYAYCVRQMQYEGTNNEFAKAIIAEAIETLV